MQKTIKLFFLFALIGTTTWAQDKTSDRVETFIKVWGFLKYNHPVVATGIIDWDSEFVQKLSKIEKAGTAQEVNQIYLDWLMVLKTPKACLTCNSVTVGSYPGNTVVDWMAVSELSMEVRDQLNYILQNRNTGKNYYVQFHQRTRLPLFNNERKISTQPLPNQQQRLLGLARFWNAIQYFYPYKHLATSEWNGVLKENISVFQAASSALDYQLALLNMNTYLANSNAFVASDLIFEKIGKKKVPFKIEKIQQAWKVVRFENDSLAALGNLRIGDVITQVDSRPIENLVEEKKRWVSASNDQSQMVSVGATLLNGETATVEIQLVRNGELQTVTQSRFAISDFDWESEDVQKKLPWSAIDDKTIWLSAKDLELEQINAFQQFCLNKRNLILDLRDYKVPSVFKLADYLVPRSRVFAQMVEPNIEYVGNFKVIPRKNEMPEVKQFFTGNTYVLVDEKTRGQAELLAMLFKGSDRITLVGNKTSGTVGYTTKLVLPGDVTMFFTGIGMQHADGRDVQQKGIEPDLVLDLPLILENEKQLVEEILLKSQKN